MMGIFVHSSRIGVKRATVSFSVLTKIRTKWFYQNLKYPYTSKSNYYILWVALKRADYDKT